MCGSPDICVFCRKSNLKFSMEGAGGEGLVLHTFTHFDIWLKPLLIVCTWYSNIGRVTYIQITTGQNTIDWYAAVTLRLLVSLSFMWLRLNQNCHVGVRLYGSFDLAMVSLLIIRGVIKVRFETIVCSLPTIFLTHFLLNKSIAATVAAILEIPHIYHRENATCCTLVCFFRAKNTLNLLNISTSNPPLPQRNSTRFPAAYPPLTPLRCSQFSD